MSQAIRRWLLAPWLLPSAFLVYVGLRAALVLWVPIEPTSDAAWYYNRAVEIAAGLGYEEGGRPTAYWPVGYPAFLAGLFALVGPSVLVAKLANLALAVLTFFLVLWFCRSAFKDEAVARASVGLLAIYPNSFGYVPVLFTETVFTFLLISGCWLLTRRTTWWIAAATGLVFGAATYVKAQSLVLLPLFLAVQGAKRLDRIARRDWLVKSLMACIVAVACVVPWSLRNLQVFGELVVMSTNGGLTLLTGNNPSARGDYVEDDGLVRMAMADRSDELKTDRYARELAKQWIRDNPGRFVALVPMKIWRLWAPDGEAEWWYQAGSSVYASAAPFFRAIRYLNQGFYALILLGALAAMLRWRTFPGPEAWFGTIVAVFLTAISVVFSGQSRFHFPVMPFFMMSAAFWALQVRRSSA